MLIQSIITRWTNKLKRSRIKGLVNAPKHLDGIIVKSKHKQEVQRWLKSDPNITIAWVKIKLKEFKKTLIEIKEKNPNKAILFFDESRFKNKSKTEFNLL